MKYITAMAAAFNKAHLDPVMFPEHKGTVPPKHEKQFRTVRIDVKSNMNGKLFKTKPIARKVVASLSNGMVKDSCGEVWPESMVR